MIELEADRFLSLGRGVGGGEVGIEMGKETSPDDGKDKVEGGGLAKGGGVFGGIGRGVVLLGEGRGRDGAGYSGWVGEVTVAAFNIDEGGGGGGDRGPDTKGTDVATTREEEGDR